VEHGFADPAPIGDPTDFALARQAQRLISRATAPQTPKVIVNLTYRCNNHCEFCAVGDRPPVEGELDGVLDTIAVYRSRGYEHLDIDGGEPTLHPDLPAIVQAAKRLGYRHVTLVSNGRRLSYAGFARHVVRAGLDEILISLHAPTALLQDALTGAPGSFEQTSRGILNSLDCLPANGVAVNTTIVQNNLSHLSELARLIHGMGVRRWNLQLVTPFGRARGRQLPQTRALKDSLSKLLRDLPDALTASLVNVTPCLLPGFEHLASEDYGKAGRDMVFVGADGLNLQQFLAARRTPDELCSECLYSVICPGHYVFGEANG
jgi:MoaA/NifB/PqqE/SkfB family radical SAM enzyme